MPRVPRNTPSHIGWLLPGGTLFFTCGILLGRIISAPWMLLPSLLLALVAAVMSHRWRRFFAAMLAVLAVGALLGWAAYHPHLINQSDYAVEGTIVQEIDQRDDGQVQTLLASVTLDGFPAPDAYWTFYLDEEESLPEWLTPGARVRMTAEVYHPDGQVNPDGFNYQEYLLQRGVRIGLYGADDLHEAGSRFTVRGLFAALRHRLVQRLMHVMGPESGAYAAAMLLGARDFIPEDDRAAFNALGIAHILTVSGFHVGVLAGLLLLLLKPLPLGRCFRLVAEGLLLGFYCLLAGGSAPVIRATGLLLWREFTRLQHRQVLPLHALCVTAVAQLLVNPTLLTSPSFQLTYGAMLGLTLVYPRLKDHLPGRLWRAFAASISAQLGILLPQLYWFGELPLLAILLNPVIIPLAGLLITLYWLTLAALPIPGLNLLLGGIADWGTQALLALVRTLARWDFASLWTRQADGFTFLGWVLLLLGLSILLPRRAHRWRWLACGTGALLLAAILLPLPENTTRYTQFSVGNADAAVLQDRDMTVVIDVGEDGRTVAEYLHQRRQSVEVLIITHLHTDHASGIRALLDQGIPIQVCYLPYAAETPVIDEEVLPLMEELCQSGTEIRYLSRGDVIPLPSGHLAVLWPEKGRVFPQHNGNDVNLVLQADIAGVTLLLTGDMTSTYAKYIAQPSDILKIPHHGSKADFTADFLASVHPQVLLQSNRDKTREAHVAALAGNVPLYATEQQGAVTIDFLGDGVFEISTILGR